jgi:hypothetical protein
MSDLLTTFILFIFSLGLAGYYLGTNHAWMVYPLMIVALISLKLMTNEIQKL